MERKVQGRILAQKRHHLTGHLDQKFQNEVGLQRSREQIGFSHKPETTFDTVNDDVLALLDPKFKRTNFKPAWRA